MIIEEELEGLLYGYYMTRNGSISAQLCESKLQWYHCNHYTVSRPAKKYSCFLEFSSKVFSEAVRGSIRMIYRDTLVIQNLNIGKLTGVPSLC